MTLILVLFAALGIAPLAVGLILLARRPFPKTHAPMLGSILLCALAFNLVFFWQELWLVVPKALTPGLHPVLFHNDHEWTGDAPTVELLQGSGAIATCALGLVFTGVLAAGTRLGATIRLFCFWMAFEGLYQALTQLAVGIVVPGNDVGRALAYLGVGQAGHIGLAIVAILGLVLSGRTLARLFPAGSPWIVLLSAIASILLIVPFRVPRNPIETTLIPLIVNGIGAGWTMLGFAFAPRVAGGGSVRPKVALPALCLLALMLVFQLALRPGIRF